VIESQIEAVRAEASRQGGGEAIEHALTFLRERGDADAVVRGVETAEVLLPLRVDAAVLTAGLVHGVPDEAAVRAALGEDVAGMVDGVRQLRTIRWDRIQQETAERLRKMFLAIASDLRVVLIALAAAVHEMRHVDEVDDAMRHRRAGETMDVYAPLANRLGIWQLKWELEDLAFRALEPDTYREIKRLLAEKRRVRTQAIDSVIALLKERLREAGIEAEVLGRPKHIYSIYKKMKRKRVGFDQIYDVNAVRIIVREVAQCYAALGLVHAAWTPIDGEFDDYIAKPKENFYRSLHTAVFGPDGKPLEVQIRTREMHEYNESGVAAHWRYKEAKKADRRFDEKIDWVRQLMQWQRDVTDPREVARSLKTDIFADQVYVFTPTGDVIDLPQGATPIDFAYRIHTAVGHGCRGAKVNGQIVALHHALSNGDRVEIITGKGGPSRDWLNPHEGLVRTAGARQKIRQYFRAQRREESIAMAREMVERELKRVGVDVTLEQLAAKYPKYGKLDDFLAAVGYGDISVKGVGARALELEAERAPAVPVTAPAPPRKEARRSSTSVSVAGVDDVLSRPARCCAPVPGDDVVGFITRGRGIIIHRADCPNVKNNPEPERWMALDWGVSPGETYPVEIQIVAGDRKGLLRDIADLVATEGINMTSTTARQADDDLCIVETTLQIRANEQLVRVLTKLGRLEDVTSARRLTR
jgi:GTP pyrophosphokinase